MNYSFTRLPENRVETITFVQIQSQNIEVMLEQAVEFMTGTKDPSHGMDHLNNLLKEANRFFKSAGEAFDIDKEVLLLALYWHDVWKSQHIPTAGNYLFHQLYEGLGSMFMFRKYAKIAGLSSGLTGAVSYAIRKHSAFQLRAAKTLEAQLLWDIDTLDIWNAQRTKSIFKGMSWSNISLFDSYILYLKTIGFRLNFEWTKNEVKKIKPLFFKEMSRFRESLVKGNQKTKPLFAGTKPLPTKWNMDNKS